MWFEDGDSTGRRWSKSNKRRYAARHPILAVNTRLSARRVEDVRRVAGIVLVVFVLTAATAFAYFGYGQTRDFLFTANPDFTIRTLDIQTKRDAVITPALVREYTGLAEGTNLFEVSIGQIRQDFLARVPNVRDVEITRYLPDTLKIEVFERDPIAVIQQKRGPDVFVDGQGYVFAARSRREGLPAITGYGGPVLRLGQQVGGLLRDAVLTLDTAKKLAAAPELGIVGVDAQGRVGGRDDGLQVKMDGGTVVNLWWPRRDDDSTRGLRELQNRLTFLAGILRRARRESQPVRTLNLTLDSYVGASTIE